MSHFKHITSAKLTVLSSNDLRYPICIAASLKTGFTPMLTSPRNSVEGQQSLLRSMGCRKIIYSSEIESQIKEIKRAVPEVHIFEIPSLDDLMYPKSQPLSYAGCHRSELDAVCLVLHTSGSTGMSTKQLRGNSNRLQDYQSQSALPLVVSARRML